VITWTVRSTVGFDAQSAPDLSLSQAQGIGLTDSSLALARCGRSLIADWRKAVVGSLSLVVKNL
jgi:hypothetical protein